LGRPASPPPAGAARTTLRHRVAFYETDAMAIVHHANYVRFLELVRVVWMDEHDRPYREYAAEGLHFATTRVEIDYRRSASFDDAIDITAWMEWVRGASLGMAYQIHRGTSKSVEGEMPPISIAIKNGSTAKRHSHLAREG
jgi:acyl-CoA thioester hydrolase